MTSPEVSAMGLTCARVPAGGRGQMLALAPPVWVDDAVNEVTLTHVVWVDWFGQRLVVDGVHLGPKPGDFEWSHEESNPAHHWNLQWMSVADADNDPADLPDALREQLPSDEAWQRSGEWLLGILMVARLAGARLSSAEFSTGIAETWAQFVAGFADA